VVNIRASEIHGIFMNCKLRKHPCLPLHGSVTTRGHYKLYTQNSDRFIFNRY